MKSLRSHAILGAVLGLSLCGTPAYAHQAPGPESSDQVTLPLPEAVPADGMDVREYVSNELEPAERNYMRNAINKLPARTREKILSMDPGKVSITIYDGAAKVAHYNRPEFTGSVAMEPDFDLPGDEYPAELRETDAGAPAIDLSQLAPNCPTSPPPGCYAGSGPYRRIFTNKVKPEIVCPDGVPRPCTGKYASTTNEGYWNAGVVSVNCQAGSFIESKTIGEAGFVYLGGWSPTASTSEKGSIVDAGLQYNYELSKKSKDDYSLFLKISGEGDLISQSTKPPGLGPPSHIGCQDGGTVGIEFRVMPWEFNFGQHKGCTSSKTVTAEWQLEACGTVALLAQRGWALYGFQVIVFVAPDTSYGGWGHMSYGPTGGKGIIQYFPQAPCANCVFKWMTSIGQKNTKPFSENLTDGSYYSATWSEREIAPWAEPGVKLPLLYDPVPMTAALTFCSEYPVWTKYNESSLKGDCKNTPKGLTGLPGVVLVTNYEVSGETDTIRLKKP